MAQQELQPKCPPCLEDLNIGANCDGSASGIKKILYALHDDVKKWADKKPWETRTALADHVNAVTGDIVMKTGKRFFKLESKRDSAELSYVGEGNAGSRSFKDALEVYHPGFRASLLGFGSATQNKKLVFLVLTKTGDWYLLGDKDEGVEHETFDSRSGKASTDDNGANMIFSRTGVNAPTIYKGNVDSLFDESSGSGS
jgi:hypothetical protein